MGFLLSFVTALAACFHLGSSFQIPLGLRPHEISPSLSRMHAELGSQLCEGSSIYVSSNPDARAHTERWSTAAEGDVLIVVAANCAGDVVRAVLPLSYDI